MHEVECPTAGQQRLLATLERLLTIQALQVEEALNRASQWIAEALDADKVDAFLHDPAIGSLVAVGSSDTPMARLQHRLGLSTVSIANGGYAVDVFLSGESYHTGRAEQEPNVPVGIWKHLGARSILSVPLPVGEERRGVLEIVSAQRDRFCFDDLRFAEAVARWVGMVAQRAELADCRTREAAAQARHLAAEELVAVLAHDLRTPLTAATGYLDLLHRRAAREGRQQEVGYTDQMRLALRRLSEMIDALLDASRLQQGLFALSLQPVDLVGVIHQTVETLSVPGAPIRIVTPDDVILDQADPERLQQALENLISNALKHAPTGMPVVIGLDQESRDDGEWALLSIHNDGPGIAPDLLPTLFERFARGTSSTGLGLGLYLARGIAEAHGGTLTVNSLPGSGTTFYLALPRAGARRGR